jgi:hypothetical protein
MESKMTICSNKTKLAEYQQWNKVGEPWQLKWSYWNEITQATKLQG